MITHDLIFDNTPSSINYQKYGLSSTNNTGGTLAIFHRITFGGVVVRDWNLSVPSYTIADGGSNLHVWENIPLIEGKQVTGEYTFQFRHIGSSPFDEWYKVQFVAPGDVGGLKYEVKCACPKLLIKTEFNDYGSFVVANKTYTVKHPSIPGETPIPDTISTDEELEIQPKYSNVSYSIKLEADLSRLIMYTPFSGSSNQLSVEEFIGIDQDAIATIKCMDVCKFHSCMKKAYSTLRKKIKANGGFSNLSISDKETWTQLLIYSNMYLIADKCGDKTQTDLILNDIKDILECGCGCDDEVNDDPILIT